MDESTLKSAMELEGFAIFEDILSRTEVAELLLSLERVSDDASIRKRGGIFAVRNLLDIVPEVRKLADSSVVEKLLKPVLGDHFFPVRGILFDKIPGANWKVPWHQDVTIAVQEKVDLDGFGPWSMKSDVLHVQPPASILEDMVSIRFHVDHCGADNGALRVIPSSHRYGRISEVDIHSFRAKSPERICAVGVGGALMMKPLLLHASSPSETPGHRRVVHIDFASRALPGGLRWLSEPFAQTM